MGIRVFKGLPGRAMRRLRRFGSAGDGMLIVILSQESPEVLKDTTEV